MVRMLVRVIYVIVRIGFGVWIGRLLGCRILRLMGKMTCPYR